LRVTGSTVYGFLCRWREPDTDVCERPRAMRIGIDGGCLANRRGFGRFARQLLHALAESESPHEFLVFVDRPSATLVEVPQRFSTVLVDVNNAPSKAASSTGRRSISDLFAMTRAVASARLDLMYFPATYSFFPTWNVNRVVVTMHDTLALAHPELVFPTWQGRAAWTLKEHAAARFADMILTVSESAKRDIRTWFRLSPDRVGVLTEGPEAVFSPRASDSDSEAVLKKYSVDPGSRYFLYVGGLSPHKNLPRLFEAFVATKLPGEGTKLVVVGDLGDVFHTHIPQLREAVARFGLESAVEFTGFVPDEDLVHLYNRAYALVQPSLMEGFGLPAVEAMACGTPIVSSTAGSLPEVVGDAGIFFDPLDVSAMAKSLRMMNDSPALREELGRKALERASCFTWTDSAARLLSYFEALDPSVSKLGRSA